MVIKLYDVDRNQACSVQLLRLSIILLFRNLYHLIFQIMDTPSLLFLGLAVALIIVVPVTFFFIKKKTKQKQNGFSGDGNSIQNGEGNTSITVGNVTNNFLSAIPSNKNPDDGGVSIDRIKNDLKVIFVDDKKFNVVDLLKKNGWKQISYKRDIIDIDAIEVREAHVLFLDINGVGVAMGFHNQGMGLCGALKRKYGDQKRVVLYSGETSGDIFDSDARMADDTLKKDSDLYQFTALMERYGKELL